MKRWYNNGVVDILREESSDIPEGFKLGRCNLKTDAKKLATAKGKKWYNNGEDEKYFSINDEIPKGYKPGRLKLYWITNGIEETRIRDLSKIPDGWYQGFSKTHVDNKNKSFKQNYKKENHPMYGKHHTEQTKKKISESEKGENHWAWGTKQSKELNKKKSESLKEYYKKFPVSQHKRKLISQKNSNPSQETREKMSLSAIKRITENGFSCKGKAGWYNGYHCMSSWELAYVIYNIEHSIPFKQNKEWFTYEYQGQTHRYLPDFIEGDTYIEIKGFYDDKTQIKINQFPNNLKLKVLEKNDMTPYIDYVISKYGKDFTKLYERQLVNSKDL